MFLPTESFCIVPTGEKVIRSEFFGINKSNGQLEWIDHQSTLGKTPRNFNFDPTGNFLLVANQNSDEIVIFKRDKETGLLTDSGKRIKVSKPVCLKWMPLE
jgi:6-phosphogluconolactonase